MTNIYDPIVYDGPYRYVREPHVLRTLAANTAAPSTLPPRRTYPSTPDPVDSLIPPRQALAIEEAAPTLPRDVSFDPSFIELHRSWRQTALCPAMQDNFVDLESITPAMLRGLPALDLGVLLHTLAGCDVQVTWYDDAGRRQTGPKRRGLLGWLPDWGPFRSRKTSTVNAAAAVALQIAASGDAMMLALVWGACPGAVVEQFSGTLRSLVRLDILEIALRLVLENVISRTEDVNCVDRVNAADGAGRFIELFLEQHVGKRPDEIENALGQLLRRLLVPVPDMDDPSTPARLGVLFGVTFAGALKFCYGIKASDEMRHRAINSTLSLLRVTLGLLPRPINVLAQIGVQIAQIGWDYGNVPRNYIDALTRFEGEFELEALTRPIFADEQKIDKMLHFAHAVQLANGLRV